MTDADPRHDVTLDQIIAARRADRRARPSDAAVLVGDGRRVGDRRRRRQHRGQPPVPQGRALPEDRLVQGPRDGESHRHAERRGPLPRRDHALGGERRPGVRVGGSCGRRAGHRGHAVGGGALQGGCVPRVRRPRRPPRGPCRGGPRRDGADPRRRGADLLPSVRRPHGHRRPRDRRAGVGRGPAQRRCRRRRGRRRGADQRDRGRGQGPATDRFASTASSPSARMPCRSPWSAARSCRSSPRASPTVWAPRSPGHGRSRWPAATSTA